MRPHPASALFALLLLLSLAAGCGPTKAIPSATAPAPTWAPTRPRATLTAHPTARPTTPPPAPSAPPSPAPSTVTPPPTGTPVCALPRQETIDPLETLSGLILYIGPDSAAGALPAGGLHSPPRGQYWTPVEQLWAISPDGRRIGRLTDDRAGIGYLADSGPPAGLLVLSAQWLQLPAGPVRQPALPAVCQRPADLPSDTAWLPCSDFRLSADGRWAAFLQGEETCGRSLVLLDLVSGESQLLPGGYITWLFQFLPDGRLLLTRGHCEGALAYLRDVATGEEIGLGGWGQDYWSPDGTALAVRSMAYMGWESAVWGFDLQAARRFLAPASVPTLDDAPLWTPDGTHLLYQHRALTYTTAFTFGPRQIVSVEVLQGRQRLLLGDPGYDYYLGMGPGDTPWYGADWLPVRRVRYHPQEYPSVEGVDFSDPAVRCLLYGESCPDPVEHLVLNWRSGEVLPAGQFALPTPLPPPMPTATPVPWPDLGGEPLYSDPAGRYALYVGAAGQGLWCIPASGQPVQWLRVGHHFFHMP